MSDPTPTPLVPWPNEGGFYFAAHDNVPEYRDTLWLTQEEMDSLSDAEKNQRMQDRYDSWLLVINPPDPVVPTVQSIQEQIDALNQQTRDAVKQRLELEDQLVTVQAAMVTRTWVGKSGGSWASSSNWQDDNGNPGAPNPNDKVVLKSISIKIPKGTVVEGIFSEDL